MITLKDYMSILENKSNLRNLTGMSIDYNAKEKRYIKPSFYELLEEIISDKRVYIVQTQKDVDLIKNMPYQRHADLYYELNQYEKFQNKIVIFELEKKEKRSSIAIGILDTGNRMNMTLEYKEKSENSITTSKDNISLSLYNNYIENYRFADIDLEVTNKNIPKIKEFLCIESIEKEENNIHNIIDLI